MNKGGLNKCIFLTGIFISIFLISFVSSEILTSEAGVQYDSNLVKVFNNQTFVNEVKNQSGDKLIKSINNETWVRVIIRLNNKLNLSEFSDNKSITILNNLSDGFVGIINQKGFEELTNNLDIKEIQMDIVGSTSLYDNKIIIESNESVLEINSNNTLDNQSTLDKLLENKNFKYWFFGFLLLSILLFMIIKIIKNRNEY